MAYHSEIANDQLTYKIIGIAIALHKRVLGALPEHSYRDILCQDLREAGFDCQTEYEIEVIDRGRVVARRYADLIVNEEVILELKAVRRCTNNHLDQLGANVRAAGLRRGLLLNFGASRLQTRRFVNPDAQPLAAAALDDANQGAGDHTTGQEESGAEQRSSGRAEQRSSGRAEQRSSGRAEQRTS